MEELGFINNCEMGLATIKYFYHSRKILKYLMTKK